MLTQPLRSYQGHEFSALSIARCRRLLFVALDMYRVDSRVSSTSWSGAEYGLISTRLCGCKSGLEIGTPKYGTPLVIRYYLLAL